MTDNGNLRTKEKLIQDQFGELVGRGISIPEASEKYGVPDQTIRNWVNKEYVSIVQDGWPRLVDEAEVAYCVQAYHERIARGTKGGVPLLDEDGLPYELMHPELSEYRRRRKQKA